MSFVDRWLDRAIGRLGYVKARGSRSVNVQTMFGGEAPYTHAIASLTDEEIERLAVTCGWVASDVNLLAHMLASIPFGVHRKKGEELEPLPAHDFETLFEWPAPPLIDQSWLLEFTAWWYLLRGEAYWWQVPDRSGQLAQLWPIPASRMQPIPDAKQYIRGYAYTSKRDGKPQFIPPEYVVYFRRPNPFDFHRGMSPISHYKLEMESDREAATWNRDAYKKGLSLDAILSLPKEMSDNQFRQANADIKTGMEVERKRWMIIRAGDLKATVLGMTPREAEYLAGRHMDRDLIDRIYGFPEGFWSVQANRANSEAAKATVVENTVWPMAVAFAKAITSQVLRPRYGDDLRGEFEDIRPRDRKMVIAERRQNWQVLSVDEARAELNREPFADPEIGAMPVPWVSKGMSTNTGADALTAAAGMQGIPGTSTTMTKGARDDLRRWKSIAVRRVREGNDPAGYDFETEQIPRYVKGVIISELAGCKTEGEVKAAFAAGFREAGQANSLHGWDSYP